MFVSITTKTLTQWLTKINYKLSEQVLSTSIIKKISHNESNVDNIAGIKFRKHVKLILYLFSVILRGKILLPVAGKLLLVH